MNADAKNLPNAYKLVRWQDNIVKYQYLLRNEINTYTW